MKAAALVRRRIAQAPDNSFVRVGQVADSLARAGKTQRAVESEFSRQAQGGSLARVCKGLYWKPRMGRFGPSMPGTLELALEIAGTQGTGPTGWSASNALGLSTQVSPTLEMAVVGKSPAWTPPGVCYHARANKARLGLGFWEVAWLEVLREGWTTCEASLEAAGEKFGEQVALGEVDANKLVEAAGGETAKVRQLLGELMARQA